MTNEFLAAASETYCTKHKVAPTTRKLHLRSVRIYSDFLKRPALVSDLNDLQFSRWMENRSEHVSRETLRGEAAKLLNVWRWCASPARGWVSFPEVESPESHFETPRVLDKRQLADLWAYVKSLTGCIGTVPERIFWPALFGLLWDTEEEMRGILRLRAEDVNVWGLRITIYPGPGRQYGSSHRVHVSTMRAVTKLLASTNIEEPFTVGSANMLYKRFRRMRVAAGLPTWATFHTIRKSETSRQTVAGGQT